MKRPILMTEAVWATSQLSIARHYGRIRVYNTEYLIVNKEGKTLAQCSREAVKKGYVMAIPQGEPADLVQKAFVPLYHKLGRDAFLSVLEANKGVSESELKQILSETVPQKEKKEEQQSLSLNFSE